MLTAPATACCTAVQRTVLLSTGCPLHRSAKADAAVAALLWLMLLAASGWVAAMHSCSSKTAKSTHGAWISIAVSNSNYRFEDPACTHQQERASQLCAHGKSPLSLCAFFSSQAIHPRTIQLDPPLPPYPITLHVWQGVRAHVPRVKNPSTPPLHVFTSLVICLLHT